MAGKQEADPILQATTQRDFLLAATELEQLRHAWAQCTLGLCLDTPSNFKAFVKAYATQVIQAVVRKFKATYLVRCVLKRSGKES